MAQRTAVLIPSYNEAKAIGGVVDRAKELFGCVYVVDDGSSDSTAEIAATHGAIVISHEVNEGKGAALRDGFSRVVKDDYGYILVMDGDGQHRPDDGHAFFQRMGETNAGIVIGSRMEDTKAMPLVRAVVNRLMSFLISRITGQRIPDTQCGFRLIKREVVEGLVLSSSHYELESEILIKAARKGWRIESVPITTVYQEEKSRIRPLRDTRRFFAMLFQLLCAKRD
jgi:glycosyltransferase involved in cell wall biosynthesis